MLIHAVFQKFITLPPPPHLSIIFIFITIIIISNTIFTTTTTTPAINFIQLIYLRDSLTSPL